MTKNIVWFKTEMASQFVGFSLEYRKFIDGDFGDLERVEFNNEEMGGEIEFWSSGCSSFYLVDYVNRKELMNVFLDVNEDHLFSEQMKRLVFLLKNNI